LRDRRGARVVCGRRATGGVVGDPATAQKGRTRMKVSPELDNRFRDAAAAAGLLDVAYDVVDTPIGQLLVAATDAGLCRISYDPEPERFVEGLARTLGTRVLRSARPVDETRRQLDEYFDRHRTEFDLDVDLRLAANFSRRVLEEL